MSGDPHSGKCLEGAGSKDRRGREGLRPDRRAQDVSACGFPPLREWPLPSVPPVGCRYASTVVAWASPLDSLGVERQVSYPWVQAQKRADCTTTVLPVGGTPTNIRRRAGAGQCPGEKPQYWPLPIT